MDPFDSGEVISGLTPYLLSTKPRSAGLYSYSIYSSLYLYNNKEVKKSKKFLEKFSYRVSKKQEALQAHTIQFRKLEKK